MYKYKASVIIPTFNRSYLLDLTLMSLKNQIDIDKNEYEIIVIDDGSTDDTYDIIKKYKSKVNLKYLLQEHNGYGVSKARNKGAKLSEGEVLIFLDCGILASNNFIREHLKYYYEYNSATLGVVLGYDDYNENYEELMKFIELNNIENTINTLIKNDVLDMREPLYKEHGYDIENWLAPWVICWTGNFSLSNDNFEKYGGFDETYTTWGGEDTDLGIKLYINNIKIRLNKTAIGVHYPHEKEKKRLTIEELKNRTREKRVYMYKKYKLDSIKLWIDTNTFDLNRILLAKDYKNEDISQ